MLAQIGSTPYNVMLLLHVLGAIVAFGAAFVHPLVYRVADGRGAGPVVADAQATAGMRLSLPAIVFTGFVGFGLAGMSEKVHKIGDDPWLQVAILVWLVQVAVYAGLVVPAQRRVGRGDTNAEGRVRASAGVMHVLLVVMLWLMVFKPGLWS